MNDFTKEQFDALRAIADKHIARQDAERELEAIVRAVPGAEAGHEFRAEPRTVWRIGRYLGLRFDKYARAIFQTAAGRMFLAEHPRVTPLADDPEAA